MIDYKTKIENIFKRNTRVVEVVSYEWDRCYNMFNQISNDLDCNWYTWSAASGVKIFRKNTGTFESVNSTATTLASGIDVYLKLKEEKALFIFEETGPFLTENNPANIRLVREAMRGLTYKPNENKRMILLNTSQCLPSELAKELEIVNIELPDRELLTEVLKSALRSFGKYDEKTFSVDFQVIEASLGLTTMEARSVFSECIVERGQVTKDEIDIIIQKKSEIIKKSGLLEFYPTKDNIDSIGGLDLFKDWVSRRSNAYTEEARKFNLPTPKGVLLLGIPGCGKSLSAKAVSNLWKFPLLKLDLGKVFGGIVGESEKNIRYALDIAKAVSPCILWIDEIEKGLSGTQSSGSTDGGTGSRVFGTLLTWLQEKTEPVFVIATANDVSQLPPELLRKGRFDEIFFIDLPNLEERKKIFNIHIKKFGRDAEQLKINIDRLAENSDGYSGAEIECAISDALFSAFDSKGELNEKDILECLKKSVPLSSTMMEKIQDLREWCSTRARKASKVLDKIPVENNEVESVPAKPVENSESLFL